MTANRDKDNFVSLFLSEAMWNMITESADRRDENRNELINRAVDWFFTKISKIKDELLINGGDKHTSCYLHEGNSKKFNDFLNKSDIIKQRSEFIRFMVLNYLIEEKLSGKCPNPEYFSTLSSKKCEFHNDAGFCNISVTSCRCIKPVKYCKLRLNKKKAGVKYFA